MRWQSDNLTPHGPTSQSALFDWLTTEGNYNRFRGGDKNKGHTKAAIAKEISDYIWKSGVRSIRAPKDILSKIMRFEESFRQAYDFVNNTGASLEEDNPKIVSLTAKLHKICPEYDLLLPIMVDLPNAHPLLHN